MLYIAELTEIKLSVGVTDTDDDAKITLLAELLQGRFDDHTNRGLLLSSAIVELHDGGFRSLLLRNFPTVSITDIRVDGDGIFEAETALDSDSFRFDPERGRVVRGIGNRVWEQGFKNVQVTYTGGFVAQGTSPGAGETAMPEGLRRAFLMQIEFEWRNKSRLGTQQVNAAGQTVNFGNPSVTRSLKNQTFMPEVETSLLEYVRKE